MLRTATIIAALALTLAATAARGDCDHFKWSLAPEESWFSQSPEPIDSGGELTAGPHAYELALKPEDAMNFVEPPTKRTPGGFGAVVRVAALPKPGLYQITLSREAWVDIVQNGARARSQNVSRQRDCPAFVKSVRFVLAAGAATLQLSGVTDASIDLAFAPAE
jgi:hypothetical protein